jgi:hypothetical protein
MTTTRSRYCSHVDFVTLPAALVISHLAPAIVFLCVTAIPPRVARPFGRSRLSTGIPVAFPLDHPPRVLVSRLARQCDHARDTRTRRDRNVYRQPARALQFVGSIPQSTDDASVAVLWLGFAQA